MKKSVLSVFLEELAGHSVALDNSVTNEDFVELQQLESSMICAAQDDQIPSNVFHALYFISRTLHKNYRIVLELDKNEV